MDSRPSLSYLPEQEGGEGAAAAGLDEVALSSPRIVGQDWEQNGGSVIDLEAEKKRYLNQKQKRALSHKRIRDLDNSLDRDRSSSSGEAEAVSGGVRNDENQLPSQEKSPEIARSSDAQGRVEGAEASPSSAATTPPDKAKMKKNLDELGDEEGRNEEGKEEWEKAADEPEQAQPSSSSSSSSSSPTNEAAELEQQQQQGKDPQQEEQVEGKPAAEEDQAGGGGEKGGQAKGGGRLLSQLKNLMGSLSSKVRDGAVAAAGMNGGEGDEGDDDEREDVWDELRVRTLRNTLVNKHMSHLDLNSKQIELVNVSVESWEDVFQEDERNEDDVARSPFSRWEIQDDTLLPMLLAIRTSANAAHKQRSLREAETSLTEFKACQSFSLAVGGLGTKITMKDYAPQVFERLRELASVRFEDYIKAWSDSRISKEEEGQEDLLAYSKDRRFLLRRVSSDQAKLLASVLPAYYLYIKGNPSSTIERFFGLHQIGAKGKKIYFVVAGNVFGMRTARQLKESFSVREPQTEERLSRAVKPRSRAGTDNSLLLPVPTGSSSPPPLLKPGGGGGGRVKASTSSSALASTTFGGSGRSSPLSRSDGSGDGSSAPLTHLSDSSIPVVLVVPGLSSDPPSQASSPYGTPLGSPSPSPPPSPLASAHPIIIPRTASNSPSHSPSNSPPSSPSVGPRKRSRTGLLGWRSLRSADTQQGNREKASAEDFTGDASQLPEPSVHLSRTQRAALLKQLDDDTKRPEQLTHQVSPIIGWQWLAQTGLANYSLMVGVASASDSEDSVAAVPGAPSDSSAGGLPSMVCFVELPSREARKLGKPIHQPLLLPDHAPNSVLKPRYRAHTFNDAPGKSTPPVGRPSAPREPRPGGSASSDAPGATTSDDGTTTTTTTRRQPSPYHAGILSTTRLQADAGAADWARAGRSGEGEGEEEDDDGGFFLHLRQGARKMSGTPHGLEKVKETGAEGEGAEAQRKGVEREGEVGQQRPEGEPSVADQEEQEEKEKKEEKKEATVERLYFGITDILHKPAPRNSIRKVMGGGGGLSAAQYAQSLCEAIAGRIVDGGRDDK